MPYNLTLGHRLVTINAPQGYPDITDVSRAIETAVFNNTNLAKLRVRSALIDNIDIWDALLSEASFFSCTLTNCDFRTANLMDASIADSKVENCNFNGGKLQRFKGYSSIFKRTHFKRVEGHYANFEHSTFEKCSLRKGIFECGNFFRSTMNCCDLQDASFFGVIAHSAAIKNCSFDNSNLKNADFRNSSFTNCSFKNCILTNANLKGADFTNCDFSNAIVDGVMLGGAVWDSKTGEFLDKLKAPKPVPKFEQLPVETGPFSFSFNDHFSYASSQVYQNLLTSSTGNSIVFYPRQNYTTTFSYDLHYDDARAPIREPFTIEGRSFDQMLEQALGPGAEPAMPTEPIPDINLDEENE